MEMSKLRTTNRKKKRKKRRRRKKNPCIMDAFSSNTMESK
jgi:hypothetical protein